MSQDHHLLRQSLDLMVPADKETEKAAPQLQQQVEKLPWDNLDGGIDTTLRVGLPHNDDQQQPNPQIPNSSITQDFSNMNVHGYYPDPAWENFRRLNRGGNENGTLGYTANHHSRLPETGNGSNNWNGCGYLGVPSAGLHNRFNNSNNPFHRLDFLYNLMQWRNASRGRSSLVRTCAQCNTTQTPMWRKGSAGPQTLCNACGLRYSRWVKRVGRNNGL